MSTEDRKTLQKIRKEFAKFQRTLEELHALRQVAQDLRDFREMIRLKQYD